MKKIIVIEGVDGSGKTTCANFLAERIDGVVFRMPSKPYELIREEINMADVNAKMLFYMSANLNGAKKIIELLNNTHVVSDRYYLSTLCYHIVEGANLDIINKKAFIASMPKPDLVVCLTVSSKTTIDRILKRGGEDIFLTTSLLSKLRLIEKHLVVMTKSLGGIIIDTNNKTPEEIRDIVTEKINYGE